MSDEWKCSICGGINPSNKENCLGCNRSRYGNEQEEKVSGECANCKSFTDDGKKYAFYYGKKITENSKTTVSGGIRTITTTTNYKMGGSMEVVFCKRCMALKILRDKKDRNSYFWFILLAIPLVLLGLLGGIVFIGTRNEHDIAPLSCWIPPLIIGFGLIILNFQLNKRLHDQIISIENKESSANIKDFNLKEEEGDKYAIDKERGNLVSQGYDSFFTRSTYIELINKNLILKI
jgi:hypothetical protein